MSELTFDEWWNKERFRYYVSEYPPVKGIFVEMARDAWEAACKQQSSRIAELERERAEVRRHSDVLRDALKEANKGRCYACGWMLSPNADLGCTALNCSFRPPEHHQSHYRWKIRQTELHAAMLAQEGKPDGA